MKQTKNYYKKQMKLNQINTINNQIQSIQYDDNMTINWLQLKQNERSNLSSITDSINQLPHTYTQSLNNMCKYFQNISTYQYQQNDIQQQQQHTNYIIQQNIQYAQQSLQLQGDTTINEITIESTIKSMNINSSTGPGQIPVALIKNAGTTLKLKIHELFNYTMNYSVIITTWKSANICAIYKKKGDPSNYRPIAITSVTIRLLEKCIKQQLV